MACEVTAIVLEGRVGTLTLGPAAVESDQPITASLDGRTLTIRGQGAQADVSCTSDECTTMVADGTTVRVTARAVHISTDRPWVYLNGVVVGSTERAGRQEACVFRFPDPAPRCYKLEAITHKGSCQFKPPAACFASVEHVDVRVLGSGDVVLPAVTLHRFTGQVMGSGDIVAQNTCVQHANMTVMGSGNIAGLRAEETVNATVMGSGNVSVRVSIMCHVQKTKMGSGRIKCVVA